MNEVWAVWPTVHLEKSREMIKTWHEMGYKVAILVNPPFTKDHFPEAEMVVIQDKWKGFPTAANVLCRAVPGNIVVVVGDDVYPDPVFNAQEIAYEFMMKFPDTFGVLQPIGDVFGWTHKCAVSPWIGRAFIEKAYGGNGPYREEYFHYFSDQELQEYAISKQAFFQTERLIQYHDHWQRQEQPERPVHLIRAKKLWRTDKMIFEKRKQKGFPDGTC